MKIYTIFDSKAEAHIMLLTNENQDTIQREIKQRMAGTQIETFAEDYTLFELAAFDDVTGTITPYAAHRSITNLLAIFPKRVPDDSSANPINPITE